MIDHEQYRRRLLGDPHSQDYELRDHRADCPECSAYTQQLLRFEARLQRALAVDVPAGAQAEHGAQAEPGAPAGLGTKVLAFTRRNPRAAHRSRWLALAAGILIAAVVAGLGWLAAPRASLAAAVVAHMAGEPDAWRVSASPVPGAELSGVLQNANMRLLPSAGLVSYANGCNFRGYVVPHLVVQSARGPVTVMVLVHETVHAPVPFHEQGYRGTIVPMPGHGSIAVLMRGAETPREIDAVAARVRDSVEWIQ